MKEYILKNLSDIIFNPDMSDSYDSKLVLFSLIQSLNSKTIVELGVRDGGTTLPLLLGAAATNGIVHSVDIKDTTFICPKELDSYWRFYRNDAISFLQEWPKDKKIDFLYIDDWHAYEHVKKELDLADRLVGPDSIIVLHDTMYGKWQPYYHTDLAVKSGQWANGGVYRAVAEMDDNFWEFATLPVQHGLTILRKKYSNKFFS